MKKLNNTEINFVFRSQANPSENRGVAELKIYTCLPPALPHKAFAE